MSRSTFCVLFYTKITTQKLDNDLTMFGDKLNKVFNDVVVV